MAAEAKVEAKAKGTGRLVVKALRFKVQCGFALPGQGMPTDTVTVGPGKRDTVDSIEFAAGGLVLTKATEKGEWMRWVPMDLVSFCDVARE